VLGVTLGTGDIHAAQVVVLDPAMVVLGPECGRDSGRSAAISRTRTLHLEGSD
jgi:hypothetical protein